MFLKIFFLLFAVCWNCLFLKAENINYARDITPIIQKRCASCHRAGESAPFQLATYKDLASRAEMIQYVVNNKIMPPWPANVSYSHFIDEKVLRKGEIDTINIWIESGMMPGDTTAFSGTESAKKNEILKPDLIVKMKQNVLLKGNNKDHFYFMKFPVLLKKDTFIKAIEFVPANKKIVHHLNAHLIRFENAKKKNIFTGEHIIAHDEFSNMAQVHKRLSILNDDGTYPTLTPSVCNYLPGMKPVNYPKGIGGYKINKKSVIYVNDLHYGPSPVDEHDSSFFNIYYGPKPERPTAELILGTLGRSSIIPDLVIPADSIKKFRTELKIQSDISMLSVNPHMHLIGKTFKAYAVRPQGDTIPLIHIPQWNFRWQYVYTFPRMLKIPKGSKIVAEGIYDNTAENPENPFHPPQKITGKDGSMKTTDEMFQLIITYLPYRSGDENIKLE